VVASKQYQQTRQEAVSVVPIRFMAGRFKGGGKVCVAVSDVFFLSVSMAPAGRTYEVSFSFPLLCSALELDRTRRSSS
jgi:hypothetical protein